MRGVFAALVLINIAVAAWFVMTAPAPVAMPVPAPVAASGTTITLLREADGLAVAPDAVVSPLAADVSAPVPVTPAMCALVGAFAELLKAEYFVEHLATLGIRATVEQIEVPGEPGYWVYLPPALSRKEAMRRLHEFQDKGIDTYVIPKGELTNGISFGLFSVRKRAEERAAQLQAQGHDVKVGEMQRTYKENWVLLQPAEAARIDEALWLKLLARGEPLEMRQNFCPGVAKPENIQ